MYRVWFSLTAIGLILLLAYSVFVSDAEESTEPVSVAVDPSPESRDAREVKDEIDDLSLTLEEATRSSDTLQEKPLKLPPLDWEELEKLKRSGPTSGDPAAAEAAVMSLLEALEGGLDLNSGAFNDLTALVEATKEAGYEDFIQDLIANGADSYAELNAEAWNDTLQEMLQGDYLQQQLAIDELNEGPKDEPELPGQEGAGPE